MVADAVPLGVPVRAVTEGLAIGHAGPHWSTLDTPALLVDRAALGRNIAGMQARADRAGVSLRPHVKTHKSLAIAREQVVAGAAGLTAAKLDEVEAMAAAGARDILLASQIVSDEKIGRALGLAERVGLIVGADSLLGIERLGAAARAAGRVLTIAIEVDCGLMRCGVEPDAAAELAEAVARSPHLRLSGVFTHGGQAYASRSRDELARIARREADAALAAAAAIRARGLPIEMVSVGSTPTALVFEGRIGITELRPGNYVFLDRIQIALGVATLADCALTLAARVISRPASDRAVIDAGSKSFGLDLGAHGVSAVEHFGVLADGRTHLVRLSEEHGVLRLPPGSTLQPGDVVRVLPNHACVATNLSDRLWLLEGDHVVACWPIDAAGRAH